MVAACYGLGYLTGVAAFAWIARQRRLATTGIWLLALAGLVGGLAGANLGQWIGSVGQSTGKTILGGVAGGYLSVAVVKRLLGIRRPTGDLFAFGMSAGEAVGRWGCFVGGCCYGRQCHLPWAVWQHSAYRHPTQLYLSAAALGTFGVLLWLERRRTLPENGLFFVQGALFCGLRFIVEFFREGDPVWLGLTVAQWACLAGGLYFLLAMTRLLARRFEHGSGVPVTAP